MNACLPLAPPLNRASKRRWPALHFELMRVYLRASFVCLCSPTWRRRGGSCAQQAQHLQALPPTQASQLQPRILHAVKCSGTQQPANTQHGAAPSPQEGDDGPAALGVPREALLVPQVVAPPPGRQVAKGEGGKGGGGQRGPRRQRPAAPLHHLCGARAGGGQVRQQGRALALRRHGSSSWGLAGLHPWLSLRLLAVRLLAAVAGCPAHPQSSWRR